MRIAVVLVMLGFFAAGRAPAQNGERVHEVRNGETLWVIARVTIGDGALWPALYRANRDQIKDPERLYPGQRLRIPELDSGEREALRREAEGLGGN